MDLKFDRAAGEPFARVLLSVISRARVVKRPSYYRFVKGGSVTIEQLGLLELRCVLCAIGKHIAA